MAARDGQNGRARGNGGRMTRTRRNRTTAPTSQLALARTAASRHRCEPLEIEDPTNAALDLIEAHVRDVLRAGGEHALLRRLARLLPDHITVDARAGGAAK